MEYIVWRRRKTRDRGEERDGRGEEGHALGGRPGLRALTAPGYADQTICADSPWPH